MSDDTTPIESETTSSHQENEIQALRKNVLLWFETNTKISRAGKRLAVMRKENKELEQNIHTRMVELGLDTSFEAKDDITVKREKLSRRKPVSKKWFEAFLEKQDKKHKLSLKSEFMADIAEIPVQVTHRLAVITDNKTTSSKSALSPDRPT